MRSPLLVLLLVLLPLQLVWAAVGPHDSAPEYGVSLMTARHLCEHHQMGLAAADHVKAWVNGGATDESNCQMLCKTHNRSKGNR